MVALRDQVEGAEGEDRRLFKKQLKEFKEYGWRTEKLSTALAQLTGLESRVTILGHVQRGGTPSPGDRLLATRLGTACADFIADGMHGVLVAARGYEAVPVPLREVAGITKRVPIDHTWIRSARSLGISLGD